MEGYICLAGDEGVDAVGRRGRPSGRTDEKAAVAELPEVLGLMRCGKVTLVIGLRAHPPRSRPSALGATGRIQAHPCLAAGSFHVTFPSGDQ